MQDWCIAIDRPSPMSSKGDLCPTVCGIKNIFTKETRKLLNGYNLYPKYSLRYVFAQIHNVDASRGAGAQSVTVKSTGCGFDSPLEEMKYLLKFKYPFLRYGVEAKRGVEFCHSTRNASRIRQKGGNGVS